MDLQVYTNILEEPAASIFRNSMFVRKVSMYLQVYTWCRRQNNIKIDFQETESVPGNYLFCSGQKLVARSCQHGNEPSGPIKER